jgi:2-polyprenyl-3-methyl-5-hydroxy-6-metoxy-1,4-benzoquinol methylase
MSEKLDELVDTYSIDTVSEQYKRLEFIEKLAQHVSLADASAIELGSASGRLTALLADRCRKVVAVDGSARFLAIARTTARQQNVCFVHSMFEDWETKQTFNLAVMHHVLEHLDAPVPLLRTLRGLVANDGVLAITVPNAHALSRQLAVRMGLLKSVYDLTPNDYHHGHRRVYDWQSLEADVAAAGYTVVARHGLALKLFADFQNEKIISAGIIGDSQMRALWLLGDDYMGIAGALMMIIRPALSEIVGSES